MHPPAVLVTRWFALQRKAVRFKNSSGFIYAYNVTYEVLFTMLMISQTTPKQLYKRIRDMGTAGRYMYIMTGVVPEPVSSVRHNPKSTSKK